MEGSDDRVIGSSPRCLGVEMESRQERMKARTRDFAIRVVRLFRALPKSEEVRIIGRQALRSGASVAANYRAVGRARSKAKFISKVGTVVEEADETVFWLELLVAMGIVAAPKLKDLITEANELLAIFAASQRTAKGGAMTR
ncbi:MAG TPA: four helix bundle protein [Terriglobia bacterium]|nr:four helix bundle protein [Terriglobia bacterium]